MTLKSLHVYAVDACPATQKYKLALKRLKRSNRRIIRRIDKGKGWRRRITKTKMMRKVKKEVEEQRMKRSGGWR